MKFLRLILAIPVALSVPPFLLSKPVEAQVQYRVLPAEFNADREQQMMRAYLRGLANESLDRRLKELDAALESPESIADYQEKRRRFLRWSLGEMPTKSPLNAHITGTIDADDFTIEKLIFESQPGFYVTANVYRPRGNGPFPAVLHPVGHSENGKAYASYQRANRLLARHGFLVLCYDPIGQGERKQLLGPGGQPLHKASGEHQQLGVAPILLGQSLATYMVADAVRAIDYLCGRPDVDSSRIGCAGISGGGNLTSYLMAFDERIAAAAPGCFITTHQRKNESPGPGDAEQNLYAQIRDGFDHSDFILSRAPKPTLILAATRDFVPIEGTWEAYRQAKRVYTQLGHPERIGLVEANAKHGFGRPLREACVQFMARWLQKREVNVIEEDDTPILTDRELQATPYGQVRGLARSRSMLDLLVEREQLLRHRRPALTRDLIRKVTGIRPLADLPEPRIEMLTETERPEPQRLVFHPEPGIVLPALYWPNGDAGPILLAPADGMNSAINEVQRWQQEGHPVLIVEVRDTGETKTRNWRFFGADYYIAHMLGRCWLGMRSEDLLVCARWLHDSHDSKSVTLVATGDVGPPAQHAAALQPNLISDVDVRDSLKSWESLLTSADAQTHLHVVVRNVLGYYDLPDLQQLTHIKTTTD